MTDPHRGAAPFPPQFQALLQAEAARRARLASLPPQLRPGDVIAAPSPVRGPDLWVVASVDGLRADVVAADARRFFAPTDPWFAGPCGAMCLRAGVRVRVDAAALLAHRIDHWAAAVEALGQAASVVSGDASEELLDAEANTFRAQLQRGARLLPGWLVARELQLTLDDFGGAESASTLRADSEAVARANTRLAASVDDAQSRLRRVEELLDVPARPIELLTSHGLVQMFVHPRAISFAFHPTEALSTPPPIQCVVASGGATPLRWQWNEALRAFAVRMPHDLLATAFAAEIGAERAFRAIVAASPQWC